MERYFNQSPLMYYYVRHNKIVKRQISLDNKLICLKDFSSSIPIIRTAKSNHLTNGGGFYINISGIGIAIDPGIGFLKQFHNFGGSILDIDIVLISHSHLDHVVDLGEILSLNYDYNIYVDRETKLFPFTKLKEHKLLILCDDVTYNKYSSEDTSDVEFKKLSDGEYCRDVKGGIKIDRLGVEHDAAIDTYALKIITDNVCIGYSSDAKYTTVLDEFIRNCDISILNISEPNELDLRGKLKKNHLGYTGVKSLVLSAPERYNLISEFCCLRGDNRIELTKKLIEDTKSNNLYPVSSGVVFDLDRKEFCCSQCGLPMSEKPLIIKSRDSDALLYICANCRVY